MKNPIIISVVCAFIFMCCSCSINNSCTESVTFYYVHNEIEYSMASGVIAPMEFEPGREFNNHRLIIEKYFDGPTNYDCISPFPAGTTLEDFQTDGDKAILLLSPHMATLSGASMTVALACLTRTVIEITNVKAMQVSIQNNQIWGSDSVTLTLNSFSYYDNVQAVTD